ncbi:hypothetical protein [Fulvimarina sp. MAC3]|uniref:hypothetical protein n=1 Tax=Fulvimarina sp. MAC3 TaxID=3148887 RepID=UPI0031FE3F9B
MSSNNKPALDMKEYADAVVWRALKMMEEQGVTFEVMFDRLLTASAAHIVRHSGSEEAANAFRRLADNIEAGALRRLDPHARAH